MIKKIIEIQKIKAFMQKLDVEWSDQVRAWVMVGFDEINIHLRPGILPSDFVSGLMPKAGTFIDFQCPVTLRVLDYDCDQELLVELNES
ncbi:hypothetical protein [Pedobacter sp.]|uniref:hypothetical protein n=1 Tax=Pedobacter sp. TaxID=1411316 RepID=UPI003C5E99D0